MHGERELRVTAKIARGGQETLQSSGLFSLVSGNFCKILEIILQKYVDKWRAAPYNMRSDRKGAVPRIQVDLFGTRAFRKERCRFRRKHGAGLCSERLFLLCGNTG